MSNWWEAPHINRTYWLLEQLRQLNLTSNEAIVLLMIDYLSTTHQALDPQVLSQKCNLSLIEIDQIITDLGVKGYLKLKIKDNQVTFDYANLFNPTPVDQLQLKEIFLLIEEEFGRPLTQPEMVQLNHWIKNYTRFQIIDALRYASVTKKLSFNYINRILENQKLETHD